MNKTRILLMATAALSFASCADDNYADFRTAAPERGAAYAYLNEYGDLKTYVDRAKYPNFIMGGGTSAAEFNKQELVYALDVANFEELVTGNAFKYSSVVADNGSMDFTTIKDFVKKATDAGLSVYGHTLAWHSQQNVKYLNSLIADREIKPDPNASNEAVDYEKDWTTAGSYSFWAPDAVKANISVDGEGFKLVNAAATDNWQVQYHIADGLAIKKGESYTLKLTVKGSDEGTLALGIGDWGTRADGSVNFDTDWTEYSIPFTAVADGGFVLAQSGKFVGTLQIKNVKVVHTAAAAVEIPKTVVKYTFDDDVNIGGWGNSSTRTIVSGSHDGTKCLEFMNPSATNSWSAQGAIDFDTPLEEGKTYYLHFWAKSTAAGTVGAAYQNPTDYSGRGNYPNFDLTTEWKEYTLSTAITGDNCKRLTLNLGALAGSMYFDDLEIYEMVSANAIPLTDEEKRDTLTWAMEQWVKNMMEAVNGKVKAWDVVNEPMSDGNPMALKSGAVEGGATNFYWQDYLGKDYARTVIKFARQYGGDDLKLFINDYNLEAAYNNNRKCDGLIEMVKYWESDGVTRIDGIGSQMHVTYSLDAATQQRNEDAVVNMLQKLAATGKLIRISELDMGLADEQGNTIKTVDVTEEQHHKMADYYKFIVGKYLEIIPAAQQYGITAWGITDSPEGSGWRAGEPIGLWDANYYRKHTYAGFADGLSGK